MLVGLGAACPITSAAACYQVQISGRLQGRAVSEPADLVPTLAKPSGVGEVHDPKRPKPDLIIVVMIRH